MFKQNKMNSDDANSPYKRCLMEFKLKIFDLVKHGFVWAMVSRPGDDEGHWILMTCTNQLWINTSRI